MSGLTNPQHIDTRVDITTVCPVTFVKNNKQWKTG